MIKVYPIDKKFKLIITAEEDKVIFTFSQLTYKIKNYIAGLTVYSKAGQVLVDQGLSCFYHIKYALKDIEGVFNLDGSPYKLAFEDDKKEALTDACTDEILALPFHDKLIYSAKELINSIPTQIVNPITGKPLEGVEISIEDVPAELKKNS